MDENPWSVTITVSAFFGAFMSAVGICIACFDADALLAAVSLTGGAGCSAVWVWHVAPVRTTR